MPRKTVHNISYSALSSKSSLISRISESVESPWSARDLMTLLSMNIT